jgi:plastocyanin
VNRLILLTLLLPFSAFAAGVLLVTLLFPRVALAADADFELTIKNRHFLPAEITIPSGTKIKLAVKNQDGIPVEFESTDLSREVIVPGNSEVTIYVGPLNQGSYQFYNDFDRDMRGSIVAKPAANQEK